VAVVLVTGCSSGFGDLIARTLASSGHSVFASMRDVAGRNASAAQQLKGWADAAGHTLEVLELDVTSDASVNSAVAQVLQRAGTIDAAVNNAGASASGPLEAFSIEQMASLHNLNALGPMRVNKAVLPTMRANHNGLIIWITSTLGRVLPGRGGLYPATKWAAEGLAESLAYQIKPFGVDLTILEPGSFPTPATGKSMPAADTSVTEAYAQVGNQPVAAPRAAPGPDYRPPDPQDVADEVKRLVELPSGERPLRTVVGPLFTEGVAEYNAEYERVRAHLEEVLRRPDQAITWGPGSARR
jgi:NAD(P)-dependent dehydrogenase (short-subunit alcohol dehydrogenase family)